MTVTQAARTLHVSRMLIYRAIRDGKLHPLKSQLHRRGGLMLESSEVEALLPKPKP